MTVLPLSEVKARLSEIADEVGRTHERVHITKNGKAYVVLLAAEDLESIEATLGGTGVDGAQVAERRLQVGGQLLPAGGGDGYSRGRPASRCLASARSTLASGPSWDQNRIAAWTW